MLMHTNMTGYVSLVPYTLSTGKWSEKNQQENFLFTLIACVALDCVPNATHYLAAVNKTA